MDLPATIRTQISGDSTLAALLTGGVWDISTLGREGLAAESSIYTDGGRLKPCLVIKWTGDTPTTAHAVSGRRFAEIWVYQDHGRDVIEPVLRRLRSLLDRTIYTTDEYSQVKARWAGALGTFTADELGGASGDRARIEFTYAGR